MQCFLDSGDPILQAEAYAWARLHPDLLSFPATTSHLFRTINFATVQEFDRPTADPIALEQEVEQTDDM